MPPLAAARPEHGKALLPRCARAERESSVMYHSQEIDRAVPLKPPAAVDKDGIPDRRWLGVLAVLASSAVSITAIVTMVRLVF